MKKLFYLLVAFVYVLASNAQTKDKEEPDCGIIVFYRDKGLAGIDLNIQINNISVSNVSAKTSIVHQVFSEGSVILTGVVINYPGFASKQINLDIKNFDTLYIKIELKGGVNFIKKTKEEFYADIAKITFDNVLKTKEDLRYSYNPISDKKLYKNAEKTGTGFLVSSEGYIVTNYHVVENAKDIVVKGVNGNPKSSLSATLVLKDETNDLVILKLDDRIIIDSVRYVLKKDASDIGENVYVLGYPLINTMGSEVKLTNGLISAKSGFEGNINSYQVSAPVQPGNSGAPLFDADGNIIGIINAKHSGAENVSYAIKIKYLFDLLDAADKPIKLNQSNKLKGKPLTEQVKNISNSVYVVVAK